MLPGLDALRGLAIAGVLWHHATPRPLAGAVGRGHLGVQLFFAVSGFLITTLLLREERQAGHIDVARFWLRRALRLWPLYYAVLALFVLFALAMPAGDPQRAHFLRSLPFYATHTANWFVDARVTHPMLFGFAWSLSTEQQFYVVWPLLLRALKTPPLRVAGLLGLLLLDQLLERRVGGVSLPRDVFYVLTSFSSSIALGALLALTLDSRRGLRTLSWLGSNGGQLLALGLVAAGVLWPPRQFIEFELCLAALVVAAALGGPGAPLSWLSRGPLGALGRVSYGVYLLHVPILGALRLLAPPLREAPLALFTLGLPLCWALGALSQRGFEARFLALKPRPQAPGSALS
ncbi:MAG: acyltransferase [Polyangiaceae bacterium]